MSYKNKTYSEYQKNYRSQNKPKAKKYQENYRQNKFIEKRIKNAEGFVDESRDKSRIYICKLGDERLKIGATFIDSNRIYHLKRHANLLNLEFVPLFYYDCKDENTIKQIEHNLKKYFCDSSLGLNVNSFKNEVADIKNLNKIRNYIHGVFEYSGFSYEIKAMK